jgi:hypothetical protein
MVNSHSYEADSFSDNQQILMRSLEPEDSLPSPEAPTTELLEFSQQPHTLVLPELT